MFGTLGPVNLWQYWNPGSTKPMAILELGHSVVFFGGEWTYVHDRVSICGYVISNGWS